MLLKILSNSVSNVSGKVPLRTVLVVPFVIQIFGTVGIVGWLSFRNGQEAVNEVATQLRGEITNRIEQNLRTYLATPHQINQSNAATIRLGYLNAQDLAQWERHFWQLIQIYNGINGFGFGNSQGEYIAVARSVTGEVVTGIANQSTGFDFYRYSTSEKGDITTLESVTKNYDPRTRPWYKAAVRAGAPAWSEIFSLFSVTTLQLAAVQPIFDSNGQLEGVLSSGLHLSKVGDFLRSLKIGKTGQTFIIERSGMLVATSTAEKPFRSNSNKLSRLEAAESSDPLTKATAKYLTAHFGELANIKTSQQLEFKIEGKRQFLQVLPLQDDKGLDWLIVVVVPEADFMDHIYASTRTTIMLCLVALLLATLVGIATSKYIVQPIWQLRDAATALSEGHFDQSVNFQRSDELSVLAEAFNSMAEQLKESFAALEDQNEGMKALNEALRENESRLAQFMEAIPVGVFVIDATGKPYYANQTAQQLIGKGIVQSATADQLAEVYQAYIAGTSRLYPSEKMTLLRALKGEKATLDDMEIHQGERIIPLEVWGTPIFNEKGEIVYAMAAFQDITQRKHAEAERIRFTRELEAKNAALQQLDTLKDEFLANTSHELRTPLNGIIGIAESLIDGAAGPLSAGQRKNLSLLAASARRLANLVSDILDFAKLKHQTIELQLKPVGVREIAEIVLALNQPLIGQKDLQLINSISPDMPPVWADENRLQQILHNLVGNAIKFTAAGTVEVLAEVLDRGAGAGEESLSPSRPLSLSYLAITVCDTGTGIPDDRLDVIFESFEQADGSISREYGGTGLGLAIVKQLVRLHGGDIYVESTPGAGSRFTFTLPVSLDVGTRLFPDAGRRVASPHRAGGPAVKEFSASAGEALANAQLLPPADDAFKILVVDDEPVNLQVLANHLSLQNYALTLAASGAEALAALDSGFRPDLVVLDVMMPRMTGYEVCQKIRERFPATELPVVLLTAKNQVSDLVEGLGAGANDYLTKPVAKNELLARIKTHLYLSKLNAACGRFVPHEFLRLLEKESILDVNLGDQVLKEMTVMFCDIRSFTSLSENMTPQENFNFLNSYLSRVGPAIRQHRGFIDKYIGDGIMALFPETADDALRAATELQKQVSTYNQHRHNSGYAPIAIGIGLHTGSLMLGTIGEAQRMETTVISDAVNLASRLEGLTKLYGAGIVISDKTLIQLKEPQRYAYRFIDRVRVKGKKQPVAIFEVFEGDPPHIRELKRQTRTDFERAIILYHERKIADALQKFMEISQKNGRDKAATLYIKRCLKLQEFGMPEGWDGVENFDEK